MYSLGMRREFSARHYLIGGDWGAENSEHAHRYRMELVLEALNLDRHGYLVDIVEVEQHLEAVVAEFSGQTLNDLAAFAGLNPSIEHFSCILCQQLAQNIHAPTCHALTVKLWENEIAWASFQMQFPSA